MMQICANNQGVQFDCKHHKEYKPCYISLINFEEDALLCMMCLEKQQKNNDLFSFKNLQSIETLLRSSIETILPKWPPLNNQDILLEVEQINNDNLNEMQQIQIITKYFDDLKLEINQLIDEAQKKMIKECNDAFSIKNSIINVYNEISQKEQVKNILTDNNISFEEANNQIKALLKANSLYKSKKEEKLLNSLKSYKNRFDLSRPNELKEDIVKSIKQINFFPQISLQLNPLTSFLISSLQKSQENLIARNLDNFSIEFTKKNVDDYENIILSSFYLEKLKTYRVIFEIDFKTKYYSFFVGLTSKKGINYHSDQYSFCIAYKNQNNQYGMDKVIKGNKSDLRSNKQFELKINISKGTLEVSDFPNQKNIISINEDRIASLQNETELQIAFCIWTEENKLIIKQIEEF